MDRYEWLDCQSWLLPCCAAAAVDWFFEGFASFYTASQQQVEANEALSPHAAHLFFFGHPSSSLDPAQFMIYGKMQASGPTEKCSNVVLSFDSGNTHCLDFKQKVLAIRKWEQEQGCKICKESSYLPAGARRENACICQLLPLYITVKLKHVSMIVYSRNSSSEGNTPQNLGAIDVLYKAFEERNISKCSGATHRGAMKIGSALDNSEKPANLSNAHSSTKRIMKQFLTKLDCMSECALAATNGCKADVPWMIRLLHIMMQHVAAHKEISLQSKPLLCQLQAVLFSLEVLESVQGGSSLWRGTKWP